MWELGTTTEPVARKEHDCQAWPWIDNQGFSERDFEPEDWQTIEMARKEKFKILKGTKYICVKGKWEGEFTIFRARKDINDICLRYKFYES